MNQVTIEIKLQQAQGIRKRRPTCTCKENIDSIQLAGEALLYFVTHRFTSTQKKDFWKAMEPLLKKYADERGK